MEEEEDHTRQKHPTKTHKRHNTQLVNKPAPFVARSSTSRPDVAAMTKTDLMSRFDFLFSFTNGKCRNEPGTGRRVRFRPWARSSSKGYCVLRHAAQTASRGDAGSQLGGSSPQVEMGLTKPRGRWDDGRTTLGSVDRSTTLFLLPQAKVCNCCSTVDCWWNGQDAVVML